MWPEQIRRISLDDVPIFMELQDQFVREHHLLTQQVYEQVTLLDWQHCLVCPKQILLKPGGRHDQVISIVKQDHRFYRDLYILLATDPGMAREAGYIMYQVHRSHKRKDAAPSWHVEVKQIFVQPHSRQKGLGKLLVKGMIQALEGQGCQDIRLSVLDLNDAATRWYRAQGFLMMGLVWEYLGPPENYHLVAYQVMQKLSDTSENMESDVTFFRSEIVGEVVTVTYPDGSGPFDVIIRGWTQLVPLLLRNGSVPVTL